MGQWPNPSNQVKSLAGDTIMKRLRLRKKYVITIIGLLLVLLVVKPILFLTGKPLITTNYVEEYNEITLPQSYDANKNAAPHYAQAFNVLVRLPYELAVPGFEWPVNSSNDPKQIILKNWLTENAQAMALARDAINLPYFWHENISKEDNSIAGIVNPDFAHINDLARVFIWNAKYYAAKDQIHEAFENIIFAYKIGNHKCNNSLFFADQSLGLQIKHDAIESAFQILEKTVFNANAAEYLQLTLQNKLASDTYIPGCKAEKLKDYDIIQRTFVHKKNNSGRLWWKIGFDIIVPLSDEGYDLEHKIRKSCLTGPTKIQAFEQVEKTAALFNEMIKKTPWQIHSQGDDYLKEIDTINNQHYSLKVFRIGIAPDNLYLKYYLTKSKADALITVLAILRYKESSGQFPENLNDLVAAGFIKAAPQDVYSNKSQVYKKFNDNFTLYSIGANFKDDKGDNTLDEIFWPIEE